MMSAGNPSPNPSPTWGGGPDDARFDGARFVEPLRRLHDAIRGLVVVACESQSTEELTSVSHEGAGDVIYAIDKISESLLVHWFTREVAVNEPIVLIGEGLPDGRIVLPQDAKPSDARWRIIVDPIDGTRGLMYQKRPGWILTGVAPNHGEETTLADIEVAVQTEIPLIKQYLCDQVWAIRGGGVQGVRYNRLTGESQPLALKPSQAPELRHGFATVCRFFPGGRDVLAQLDEELCDRVLTRQHGEVGVFEDQYACTGGQLYGLASGQDRFVADLRPLVQRFAVERGIAAGHCCHPYDLSAFLIAMEAGVIVTSPSGGPLSAPLDTDSNVGWIGYSNRQIQSLVEPALQDLLHEYELIDAE